MRQPAGDADQLSAPARRALPRTIPEQIADELGAAIVAGRYAAGDRLVEQELADRFGVSRGPVREALRVLERRGLIDLLPRRGAYARALSLNAVADLFNVRIALCGLAARSMALKPIPSYLETLRRRIAELEAMAGDAAADPIAFALATTRAASAIAKGSGNEQLANVMANLADQTVWTLIWKHPLDYVTPERRREQAEAMRGVLRAIEEARADEAERLIRRAFETSRDAAIGSLRTLRGEEVDAHKLLRSA